MRLMLSVIGLALTTIRENKVRSILTVLGVVIGTATIIAVGSIMAGFDGAVTGVLRSFGTNTVFVTRQGPFQQTRNAEERKRKPLTYEEARAIEERCPAVEYVSPILGAAGGGILRARYKGNDMFQLQFFGTDEHYGDSGQVNMRIGRFFTAEENRHRSMVIVLGADAYKSLFGTEDALDKTILVAGHQFTVIGILNKPATAIPGQSDNQFIAPYFVMKKIFPNSRDHQFMVKAYENKMAAAIDEMRVVLRQERRDGYSAPDSFALSTSDQLVEQFRSITSMTALVLVVLSSIGLLVGGIGVMNIMLVSVTERTREIGIRKAIGARRSDIIMQFLTEAVVLTGLGGLLGMTIGWSISLIVRLALPSLPTLVPTWAVVAGIGVSVGIGLFFGIWPASKAARLDPVDALRYE
ncbi:MAG: ABC transporter permease [Acidobacteriota bacterium]